MPIHALSRSCSLLILVLALFPVQDGRAQNRAASLHHFSHLEIVPQQGIRFVLGGNPALPLYSTDYDIFPVEASADLQEWTSLGLVVATNSAAEPSAFLDPSAATNNKQFFRTPSNILVTPFVKPTGPHAVGKAIRYLSDPSRTNRNPAITNNMFLVQLWYPSVPPVGQLPSPYIEKQLATTWARTYLAGNSTKFSNYVSFAVSNAPMATTEARYPVLLYSTGYGGVRVENTFNCEGLASHGYVVMSVDHPDSAATLSPEGDVLGGVMIDIESEPALSLLMNDRVRDLSVMLEALAQFDSSDVLLQGRLRLDTVGAFGWSLGGGGAAELARIDERIRAVAVLDGYLQGLAQLRDLGVQKPFLGMYSTEGEGDSTLFEKAVTNAYYFLLTGSIHGTYSDQVWTTTKGGVNRKSNSQASSDCLRSFFDKYLKDQDDGLLENPVTRYPQITSFQKK